jgi:hypothetical protein
LWPGEQLRRHRAVGGIGVDNVVGRVLGIDERFDHDARHRTLDFLRPRRIDVGCEQQNFKAHRVIISPRPGPAV